MFLRSYEIIPKKIFFSKILNFGANFCFFQIQKLQLQIFKKKFVSEKYCICFIFTVNFVKIGPIEKKLWQIKISVTKNDIKSAILLVIGQYCVICIKTTKYVHEQFMSCSLPYFCASQKLSHTYHAVLSNDQHNCGFYVVFCDANFNLP